MRNHTATHLLHRALRNVAGPSARQAGSLVAPDYLRFDYPFDRALTDEEKRRIEDEVRRIVREDRPVGIAFMSMAEAIAAGADAFFDEKYGETVRTIRVARLQLRAVRRNPLPRLRARSAASSSRASGASAPGCAGSRPSRGDGADAHLARARAAARAPSWTGSAPSRADTVLDRIAALETELREAKRRLREGGGGAPRAADLVAQARGGRAGPAPRRGGRPLGVDRRAQGRGEGAPRHALVGRHRPGPRCR